MLCLDFLMWNKGISTLMSTACANRFYPLSSTVLLNGTVSRFGLNPSYVTLFIDDVYNFLCVFCHIIFLPSSHSSWLPSFSYFAMEWAVTLNLWALTGVKYSRHRFHTAGGCLYSCSILDASLASGTSLPIIWGVSLPPACWTPCFSGFHIFLLLGLLSHFFFEHILQ